MKPEVPAYLDKARDSLQAAAKLLQDGFAAFAMSRTYYAMFYIAEGLLWELDHASSQSQRKNG